MSTRWRHRHPDRNRDTQERDTVKFAFLPIPSEIYTTYLIRTVNHFKVISKLFHRFHRILAHQDLASRHYQQPVLEVLVVFLRFFCDRIANKVKDRPPIAGETCPDRWGRHRHLRLCTMVSEGTTVLEMCQMEAKGKQPAVQAPERDCWQVCLRALLISPNPKVAFTTSTSSTRLHDLIGKRIFAEDSTASVISKFVGKQRTQRYNVHSNRGACSLHRGGGALHGVAAVG